MAAKDPEHSGSASSYALHLLIAAAGIAGAAGVALAAVAAHRIESPALATAATMQMIHAAAVLGLCAIAQRAARPKAWVALGFLMLGAVSLFNLAVGRHVMTGIHLFPYAAPIGGGATILSWVIIAVLAFIEFGQGSFKGR